MPETPENGHPKTGVYICHCGTNIASVVDVAAVTAFAERLPGVVVARHYEYMCSDPGQDLIKQDIAERGLKRVVVASCSPLMHEPTFRRACKEAGVNPYLFQMANIREHCSWVHEDRDEATEKAKRLVRAAVSRVQFHEPLEAKSVPVRGDALVIGAGIAGIEAALKLADAGKHVFLVEREPSIGGHMAQFDKTFPTLDCAACILTPKMVQVGQHENIDLLTYSEVREVDGYVGNFRVKVERKPRYVSEADCNGCGDCVRECPIDLPNEFDLGLTSRKAIYRPFPQATPNVFTVDKQVSPCKVACPAGTHAAGYVALIAKGKFKEALELIKRSNPFPAICGRVCHRPCEKECTRARVDDPIAVAHLKRFIGDYEMILEPETPPPPEHERPEKVAIVGAGPAGLTAAHNLRKKGYQVTVFEKLPVVGGMMTVGIPAFRLSRAVLEREIRDIENTGVEIRTNQALARDFTIDSLKADGYRAVFIAMGAHANRRLEVPGEELEGVIPAIGFLREVNLGKQVTLGDRYGFLRELELGRTAAPGGKVAVIGGGNAALDTARTVLRQGAAEVTILYRRSREEMPAEPEWEIDETEREGVKIEYLVTPKRFIGRGGKLTGVELMRMELGEPDASGRRRPVPVEGSEYTIEVDAVLPAIGQVPPADEIPAEVVTSRWDTLQADDITLETNVPGVFAGGDAVLGPATLIEAIGHGKRAAESIHRYLNGMDLRAGRDLPPPRPWEMDVSGEPYKPRVEMPLLPLAERQTPRGAFAEVELGYSEEQAVEEASRCLKCGGCVECFECVRLCDRNAIDHDMLPRELDLEVGAIIVATGFDTFDPHRAPQYGYGRYPNVLTSLEFERMSHAGGPTAGEVLLQDGRKPESVAIIHCVGSRDENFNEYCSRVCCMYSLKFAHLVREKVAARVYDLYIDMRAFGKGYEEFYERVMNEDVIFIRGKGAEVTDVAESAEEKGRLIVKCEDTLLGRVRRLPVDMVVLATGLEPKKDAAEVARTLNLSCTDGGFFLEQHPKLAPIATSTDGIFIAGACQAPKDIPDSVAQGAGAAAEALSLIDRGSVTIEPITSVIDEDLCGACKTCIPLCPYTAIEFDDEKNVSVVQEALCKGCGTCVAACPAGAARQQFFGDEEIVAEIQGLLAAEPAAQA